MRDFYKLINDFYQEGRRGWIVGLALTFIVMAAWLRSFQERDSFTFPSGQLTTHSLISVDGSIAWLRYQGVSLDEFKSISYRGDGGVQWEANATPLNLNGFFDRRYFQWQWRCCGFGAGIFHGQFWFDKEAQHPLWKIPYWSIAVPLTLLSAYLLLSKRPPVKRIEAALVKGIAT